MPAAYSQIESNRRLESLDPTSPFFLNPASLLEWGPVTVRPSLSARFTYGNSLRSRSGINSNTLVEEISPGALFQLGKQWQLSYTPTLTFYSSKDFKDSLSQNVILSGGFAYNNWRVGLSQSYSVSSDSLIETGRQTDQESFTTSINADHYLNSKLMLQFSVMQSFRDTEAFTKTKSWSTMDWVNYQLSSRMSFGLGLGGGYDDVSPGRDMTFEQFQAKVNIRIAHKLDLAINGGGEIREILGSDADPLINPIYGASIQYHPFEFTTLSLSGNRSVSASLFVEQVTEVTSISVALNQRLLGMLSLTLSGGFSDTRFISSERALELDRDDSTTSFSASLGYSFTQRLNSSIFYNLSDNSSSAGGFSYTSSQIGLQLAYRF